MTKSKDIDEQVSGKIEKAYRILNSNGRGLEIYANGEANNNRDIINFRYIDHITNPVIASISQAELCELIDVLSEDFTT